MKPVSSGGRATPKVAGVPAASAVFMKGRAAFTCRSLAGVLVIFACISGLSAALFAAAPYPGLDWFIGRSYSCRILDREGALVAVVNAQGTSGSPGVPGSPSLPGSPGMPGKSVAPGSPGAAAGVKREHSALSDLPSGAIRIFTGSEDRRFFLHPGVDPVAGIRSAFLNLSAKKTVSGASTITMQLARLVTPGRRGLPGKIADALDAFMIEARLPKNRILELYLDSVPFGSTTAGATSAARMYFGKPIRQLSPAELCLLAVIPRNPALYDLRVNPETAGRAAARLAASLRLPGSLIADISAEAFAVLARKATEQVREAPDHSYTSSTAPHFIRYWFSGDSPASTAKTAGTFEIRTSIDPAIQARLLSSIRKKIAENREFRMTNGSGLVVDNRTGEILAWVGSGNFDDDAAKGQIDGVRAPGQPGSCLKPFLYALAIEKGYTPATILDDSPADFGSGEAYVPLNFNNRFNGPVRLRVALASSLNIPAVHTLEQLGTPNFVRFLVRLGFSDIKGMEDSAGLGLALGNAPVSLFELVRAFSVFPRGGLYGDLTPVAVNERVQSPVRKPFPAARISATPSFSATREMSPYSAGIIRNILSDQPSRFAGFAHGKLLSREYDAMFKTGTANQFQHVWALGATPDYTVGIWMGNFTGETVIGKRSSGVPASVLVEVLDSIAKANSLFPPVPDSTKTEICATTGLAATASCPGSLVEFLPRGAPALLPCNSHSDTRPGTSGSAPAKVSRAAGASGSSAGTAGPIRGYPGPPESIRFVHPRDGAVFYFDPSLPSVDQAIGIRIEGLGRLGEGAPAFLCVDGGDPVPLPRDGRVVIPLVRGEHRLALLAGDRELAQARFSVR